MELLNDYRIGSPVVALFISAALVAALIVRLTLNYFTPGLSQYPGDFLGKCTDGWRLWKTYKSKQWPWISSMLKKYNTNAVRVGPSTIYISDISVLDEIYSFKDNYVKGRYIETWEKVVNGKIVHATVDARDKQEHAGLRKPVARFYGMSSVVTMEDRISDTICLFFKRLDEAFIKTGNACDINNWLQYFAFDVIGQITFSRTLGFLEQGRDVDGILQEIDAEFNYRSIVGQMPWLHRFIGNNPLYLAIRKPTGVFSRRSKKLLDERYAEGVGGRNDFVDRFVAAKEKYPDQVTERKITMWILQNLVAGSDTTACVLRTALYYLYRDPHILARLRQELEDAGVKYPVPFSIAQSIPYVDGVIRESWRIVPVTTFWSERIVPESGLELCDGKKIPPGTVVAMSARTINFEPSVYGKDCETFNPERWCQGPDETVEAFDSRIARMKKYDFTFLKGTRTCLGVNVAKMELYKIIPTIAALLDFELVNPAKEWKIIDTLVAKQSDMDMKFKWRDGVDGDTILADMLNNTTEKKG